MHYRAIVFKQVQPTSDFTTSEQIRLPGQHSSPADAWRAVHAALCERADCIGGEVVPAFAETDAERDAETLSIP